MEVVAVLAGERLEHLDNRVPRDVGTPAHDPIPGYLERELRPELASDGYLLPVGRDIGRDRRDVEDAHVRGEAGAHESGVERGQCPGRHLGAALEQSLDPHLESAGVELFVESGFGAAPQVEVGDTLQLRGCGQCQQLSARFQPAALDHLVQQFGREPRDGLRQIGRVQNPLDERTRVRSPRRRAGVSAARTRATDGFRHGRERPL